VTDNAIITVIKPDKDAREIGELYRKWVLSAGDTIRLAHACGKRLIAKKEQVGHGNWLRWLDDNADVLRFKSRFTAAKLMRFARECALTAHLDEATAIAYSRQLWGNDDAANSDNDDLDLDELLRDEDGKLTPQARRFIKEERTRKVVEARDRRDAREIALGAKQRALPQKKYNVVYADAAWKFRLWGGDTGMLKVADNHYPCMRLSDIASLDVPSICADDCALFMCATVPMLPHAFYVMDAWGFPCFNPDCFDDDDPETIAYKTNWAWVKPKTGTGYQNLNQHEHLLLATRGKIPAPAPGTQWSSVIFAPRGRHSEKPAAFYEMIEHFYPNLPKIELFARKARPGWDAWGLEAPALGGGGP